ncbi:MAG TPA: phytanoyl-CoA dioxygenase family protein [Chitinophagales bacterium]|nr:phytanoyl-CoA dioxygenase family protein [Chitinophagales bacterium]
MENDIRNTQPITQRHTGLLNNQQFDKEFAEKGYLVIDFLSPVEVEACRALFNELDPHVESAFYSSIDSTDLTYREKVHHKLEELLQPKVDKLFNQMKVLVYTFIVKRPGEKSMVNLHLDDIHTNQEKFTAINFWFPLIDTNIQNGCLHVLPYSHKLPYVQRAFGLDFRYNYIWNDIAPLMKPIFSTAGQAIIYNDRLIHSSPANLSGAIRPAVVFGLIPEEAPMEAAIKHKDLNTDEIEYFSVDRDFWLEFGKLDNAGSKYKSLAVEKIVEPDLSFQQFMSYLK